VKTAIRFIRNFPFDFKNGTQGSNIVLVSVSYRVRTSIHKFETRGKAGKRHVSTVQGLQAVCDVLPAVSATF